MSDYNDCYVKLADNPAYWAVDGGERRVVTSQAEMVRIGIRRVVTVTEEELDAIPIAGRRKKAPVPGKKLAKDPEKKDGAGG